MTLPKLTNKQQEIIRLLYRYRFLNRIQIQKLMGHKDYKTINLWLKDLREKQYVEWIYSTDFAEKTKPAIYYVGINGVRYLKTIEDYDKIEVRKRYRESSRSRTYIDHCLAVADFCVYLKDKTSIGVEYWYLTPSDFIKPDGRRIGVLTTTESGYKMTPDLYFEKQYLVDGRAKKATYILEIFDSSLPRYMIKKKLRDYMENIEYADWEYATGQKKHPTHLLVCARLTDLIYLKRRTRRLVAEEWDYTSKPNIWFTTLDKFIENGLGEVWEKA